MWGRALSPVHVAQGYRAAAGSGGAQLQPCRKPAPPWKSGASAPRKRTMTTGFSPEGSPPTPHNPIPRMGMWGSALAGRLLRPGPCVPDN